MRARGVTCLFAALPACNGTMESYFARDVVEMACDLPYIEDSDNPRQRLDLYLPRGLADYPVVVFVHGGYWTAQDKNFFQPIVGLYGNVGIALAREGIGAAVINYRLVPDVAFDDQLDDVAHAIGWVHDHIGEYRGDATRMVIAGHSAGGHITALAAFDDARLAANVDVTAIRGYVPLSAIFDLQHMADNPPPSRPNFNAEVTVPVFGTALAQYSPRTYFKPTVAPLLIIMGDRDEPFLVEQIPAAVAELQALGAPVTFHELAGHTHDDIVLRFDTDDDEVTPLIAGFVRDVAR